MNLLKTAATISGLTLLSRITGLVRETLTAATFGAGSQTDAFFVAFRLPNLLRRLFAEGAFSQAFVPVLGQIRAQQGDGWDYQGILAYSKICTHVGCPIALYEHRTHHLLCPCHQSTFDLADAGNVIFGPAARRMPQLPIGVNEEGFLVAKAPFAEPIGPSFWERG